jgi:catechol 2,3-dioxygenase-like lactoylglutathione lyase family enzyme
MTIPTAPHPVATPSLRLSHAIITTPDLERLQIFYEDVLGLHLLAIDQTPPPPARRMGVFASETGVVLLAREVVDCDVAPDSAPKRPAAIERIVFQVDSVTEHDAITHRLVGAGACDGNTCTIARGPVVTVTFTDPDGRIINLVRPNFDWTPEPDIEIRDQQLLDHTLKARPHP